MTIERIQWQPTCIRSWTPLARNYICVHGFKLSYFNEEENETATNSSFFHLFTLHVRKKFSFNTLQRISLKLETKTSIEVQSKDEVKATWPIDGNESKKKMLYRKREISATPIQLHLKELYDECYPHTLAPNPEMKTVTYAGKTFRRCQYFFSKSWVVVACSFRVARVITGGSLLNLTDRKCVWKQNIQHEPTAV